MVEFVELDDVKLFFDFKDDELDELLGFLIEHYSDYIVDKTGVTAVNPQTKELLLLAIGCHLYKTKTDKITSTVAYTVGDVRERYQDPVAREMTWCEAYRYALEELKAQQSSAFAVQAVRRRGLSDLNEFQ